METDPADEAVRLAEDILRRSQAVTTRKEAAQMRRIARMIGHPSAKYLSLAMTDRIGRCPDAIRTARMWRGLVDRFGAENGFSLIDLAMLELGKHWSRIFPNLVVGAVKLRLQRESRDVILPAEAPALTNYLSGRAATGTRINLNQLGEAVLGEKEAAKRLASAISLLNRKDVEYVSVKVSAVFSQINLAAWDQSLTVIKSRLRALYRAAMPGGKFVNLDMEAYHDLAITVAAFREVLSEDEFLTCPAGIALQAYLPDSIAVQRELTDWAKGRCSAGGVPIKIRLVKGANLAMERVEAELHGWNPAPYSSKLESDACFKQMLEFAVCPENAAAVRLGVGSHNLFDIALALILREREGVADRVEIEMIQGMAPAQARVVQTEADSLLLYSPIVHREEYGSALAYLIRRLDENTSPGNFLASLFSLEPGSEAWNSQRNEFLAAWKARKTVGADSKRCALPVRDEPIFTNEPDTDWTQSKNRRLLEYAEAAPDEPPRAAADEVEKALALAFESRPKWQKTDLAERAMLLRACADQLGATRFASIAILRKEGKKAPAEADAEVSEAIDFARYYAATGGIPRGLEASPLGTVVITPPWNFPLAIPCGGILAALMAGNTVIVKPAPESVRIGWWLVRQLWASGIPREVLHFVACSDGEIGRRLIEDPRTSAVVLTGAFETARRFQNWRPSLNLFAETSGKNAIVISAMADRELAAADLVKSAFGHSGQKCSAVSLGILEKEVYEDQAFLIRLRDAASSLRVGAAEDPSSAVTPLVQPPGENLLRALTSLDEGEEWLLKPVVAAEDPCLWSPGIKLGVKPGSWFHHTECFGPVLGIMKAEKLSDAIVMQNAVAYGLTAGLHSLDETEIDYWKKTVSAGNLYINRGTTGAVVQRQPFGGWKCSHTGPGAKAGGPNYVNLFRKFRDTEAPSLDQVGNSYRNAWFHHFAIDHDPSALRCESNIFRYRPFRGVLLRLMEDDLNSELKARLASRVCGAKLIISRAFSESDEELASRIPELSAEIEFLRTLGRAPSDPLLRTLANHNINWINAPMVSDGRIELCRWMREQSVSETRHRYGNITPSQWANSR